MAITSAGYFGTVNDAQWASMFEPLPHWFRADSFAPTAVASVRRISLTAGVAFGSGVRDISSTATTVDLTPPSSGGQWYLIVLRRTWSIGVTGTTTVQALTGPATDGTAPSTAPSILPNMFQKTPSATDDAPIAWVHVRAADTTLAVFDARTVLDGNGKGAGASLAALKVLSLITTVPIGTQSVSLADGITYRWNGTTWKPWESDWVNYTPQISGIAGAYNADPGWGFVRTTRWRYVAGRVACRGTVRMVNSTVNGNPSVYVQMPTTVDTDSEPVGLFQALDASSGLTYQLSPWWNGPFIRLDFFAATGTGQFSGVTRWNLYGSTPFTWADGDLFTWDLTYDPA